MNADMGTSFCDRNGFWAESCYQKLSLSTGFSILRTPALVCISFGAKKVKHRSVFGLRVRNGGAFKVVLKAQSVDGGEILEKELEFKPSFEDYLKAMESVKTGRDKKKKQTYDNSLKRYNSNNAETSKLGNFNSQEGYVGGQIDCSSELVRNVMKKVGVEEKGNVGIKKQDRKSVV